MNAARLLPVNDDALFALGAHLRDNDSALSLTDAVVLAIRAWLADNAGSVAAPAPALSADADAVSEQRLPWLSIAMPKRCRNSNGAWTNIGAAKTC